MNEIAATEPFSAESHFDPESGELEVAMNEGRARGYLWVDTASVELENLDVFDENNHGQGRGSYLMKRFVQEAAQRGAKTFHAGFINTSALHIAGRLFGTENLTYAVKRDGKYKTLPITMDTAAAVIGYADTKLDQYEDAGQEPPQNFDLGVDVFVDLTNENVRTRLGL